MARRIAWESAAVGKRGRGSGGKRGRGTARGRDGHRLDDRAALCTRLCLGCYFTDLGTSEVIGVFTSNMCEKHGRACTSNMCSRGRPLRGLRLLRGLRSLRGMRPLSGVSQRTVVIEKRASGNSGWTYLGLLAFPLLPI